MSHNNPPLAWGKRTYIMGILNMTPDSFSGDGLMKKVDHLSVAIELARHFVHGGADILDIGGESTRPGSQPISIDEEMNRVIPIIQLLEKERLGCILSIDTSKAVVAEAALNCGADWVNDVWALQADPDMAPLVARCGAPIVLMHNRSKPANAALQERLGGVYLKMEYDHLLQDIKTDLQVSLDLALSAGVGPDRIILDPGIGFGKTVDQNLELVNHLDEICCLGYPILVGVSRKSFIGYTLDAPVEFRLEGTAAAVSIAIARGADIIRVHDVEFMTRLARMTDAIIRH
jgi:dihydropteroate synthase